MFKEFLNERECYLTVDRCADARWRATEAGSDWASAARRLHVRMASRTSTTRRWVSDSKQPQVGHKDHNWYFLPLSSMLFVVIHACTWRTICCKACITGSQYFLWKLHIVNKYTVNKYAGLMPFFGKPVDLGSVALHVFVMYQNIWDWLTVDYLIVYKALSIVCLSFSLTPRVHAVSDVLAPRIPVPSDGAATVSLMNH